MTKNNWFSTNLKDRTPTNFCDFEIQMFPYEFNHDSFINQAKRVAHELAEKHDNLYVCYSGGLDSEFVLKTFYEEGLPITPVLIYTPYNQFESEWAYNFCKEKGIKPEVLSFSKNEIIDRLKQKTIDRNLFSLLGGLPLIVCDEVNKQSGKIITGYGDPFAVQAGNIKDEMIQNRLQFCVDIMKEVLDVSFVIFLINKVFQSLLLTALKIFLAGYLSCKLHMALCPWSQKNFIIIKNQENLEFQKNG